MPRKPKDAAPREVWENLNNTRDRLVEKLPTMAAAAASGSRKAAIRLHCLECTGDQPGEVKKCPCTDCFLYPFRLGGSPSKRRKKGEVETPDTEYSDDSELNDDVEGEVDEDDVEEEEGTEEEEGVSEEEVPTPTEVPKMRVRGGRRTT